LGLKLTAAGTVANETQGKKMVYALMEEEEVQPSDLNDANALIVYKAVKEFIANTKFSPTIGPKY